MTVLIYSLAAIAIVLGYVYTITFMTALSASLAGVIVAIAASLVFETSKLVTWDIGVTSLKQGNLSRGITNITVSLILVVLAITAIMYSMIMGNAASTSIAEGAESQRAVIQSKVDEIQTAINGKQTIINTCAANGMVSKCVEPRTLELNELRNELKSAQNELALLPIAKVSNDEFWQSIAVAFDTTAESAKTGFIIMRSFLLEFLSLFLLALGRLLRFDSLPMHKQQMTVVTEEPTMHNYGMHNMESIEQHPEQQPEQSTQAKIEPEHTHEHSKNMQGTCLNCDKEYLKKVTWQKFCSPDCRAQANGFPNDEAVKIALGRKKS